MKRDTTIVAVPPERLQKRTLELVDEPFFRDMNEIVEAEQLILQRTLEQIQAPLVKVVPQERNSDRIVEQFVEHFFSQLGKEIVEVVQVSLPERVQQVQ